MDDKTVKKDHSTSLENRKTIHLSGITDSGSFNDEEIILYSDYGQITIKGENLQVDLLDIESGRFEAHGKINSLSYSDKKIKNMSLVSRIFR